MAYKEITALDADTTVALGGVNKKTGKKNPTRAEGYYLGKKEVASPKSKTGKANIYIFKTAAGNLGVWGKANLDNKMRSAAIGQMTLITQTGMQPTPNGDMYVYTVQQDATNTIEVSGVPELNQDDQIDAKYGGSGGRGSEYADEDETEDDEDELQAAALAKAERAAKVQALLKKK